MGAGYLLHNLLLFGRLLRRLGIDINPGRMIDLIQALQYIRLSNKRDFYFTLRSLLIHRHSDYSLFDQAFRLFWRKPPRAQQGVDLRALLEETLKAKQRQQPSKQPNLAHSPMEQNKPPPAKDQPYAASFAYSPLERLRQKDFAALNAEEEAQIRRLIAGITWSPNPRKTRRWRPGEGGPIHLRNTLRHNLKYGGEVLQWRYRQALKKPRPLVVLADVSGSMEPYSRLLLHFIYALTAGLAQPVESFVFSTRLTRITRHLQTSNLREAMHNISSKVSTWSGGTRIGEVLKAFNYDWARRLLGQGAIVLLISDGLDRGNPPQLRREVARLQRSCHRLIWLNPLLGSLGYQPLTRGMRAALPFVDDFLPLHNFASLEDLAETLTKVQRHRPLRRQHYRPPVTAPTPTTNS